jgi:Zn-dependent hydrolases, including glyoxylases
VVWSETDAQHRCAIIDSVLDFDLHACRTSTTSADAVINFVREKGFVVEWILETHIHADHLTAASYIKEKMGGKIAISKHMLDIIATWTPIFQTQEDTPADGSAFDHLFENDEEFTIADMRCIMAILPFREQACL